MIRIKAFFRAIRSKIFGGRVIQEDRESQPDLQVLHDAEFAEVEYVEEKLYSSPSHPKLLPLDSIIMVHGLQGHPNASWQAANETTWPKDLLPTDIPNARIMTFAHPHRLVANNPQRLCEYCLYYWSDDLISSLTEKRRQTDTFGRPIIFIAYSLGGMYVKSALVRSNMSSSLKIPDAFDIVHSTYGIVFLGTPQRSAGVESLGRLLERVASTIPIKMEFCEAMDYEAEALESRLEPFKSLSNSFRIYYCTERGLEEAQDSYAVLVPATASILSKDKSEIIVFNRSHSELAKFSAKSDESYRQVVDALKRIINGIKALPSPGPSFHEKCGDAFQISFEDFLLPPQSDHLELCHFAVNSREQILREIHSFLSDSVIYKPRSRIVWLHGPPCAGKTSLLRHYAVARREFYRSIWWVDCRNNDSALSSFSSIVQRLLDHYAKSSAGSRDEIAALAHDLGLGKLLDQSHQLVMTGNFVVEVAKEWFERSGNTGWLIIFENVQNLDSIKSFFPRNANGKILISSCNQPSKSVEHHITLAPTLSQDIDTNASVEPLHKLICTTELVIRSKSLRSDCTEYEEEEMWERCSNIDEVVPWITNLKHSLELSYQTLDPQQSHLFLVCSFYGSEDIPTELLKRGLPHTQAENIETSISELKAASLICLSIDDRNFSLHWSVRLWAQSRQPLSSRQSILGEALQMLAQAIDAYQGSPVQQMSFEQQLTAHITSCLSWAEKLIPQDSILSHEQWRTLGSVCLRCGNLEDAERAFNAAYRLRETLDVAPDNRSFNLELARLYIEAGRAKESEKICFAARDSVQLPDDDQNFQIEVLLCLARSLNQRKRHEEAEFHLKEALRRCEDLHGCTCQETMRIVEHLADSFQDDGRYAKAEMLRRRQLIYCLDQYGADSVITIKAQRTLADLCRRQGKFRDMTLVLEPLLAAAEQRLGALHPTTLDLCTEVAEGYAFQSRFDKSNQLFPRARKRIENNLGCDHEMTLNTIEKYAYSLYLQRSFRTASILYNEVLSKRRDLDDGTEKIDRIMEMLKEVRRKHRFWREIAQDLGQRERAQDRGGKSKVPPHEKMQSRTMSAEKLLRL